MQFSNRWATGMTRYEHLAEGVGKGAILVTQRWYVNVSEQLSNIYNLHEYIKCIYTQICFFFIITLTLSISNIRLHQ